MFRFSVLIACLLLPPVFLLACKSSSSGESTGMEMEGEQKFAWKDVALEHWRLIELNGAPVAADSNVQLTFDGMDRISGNAGVNQIMGAYKHALVDGQERGLEYALEIGQVSSTMMAGTPEAMELEKNFLAGLGEVDSARMIDGKLALMKGDTIVMRLEGRR